MDSDNSEAERIGFIGAGRVGSALSIRLDRAGRAVRNVYDMDRESSRRLTLALSDCRDCKSAQELADDSDMVFITTPDDRILEVASSLRWRRGQMAVHCSGAASLDILEPASLSGALTASFHPCQAFADLEQAIENLPGSTFAIEASSPLLERLQDMAGSLGCSHIEIRPGHKALYHAAAVFISNYYVTLVKAATDLFAILGSDPSDTIRILSPLMEGNIKNIQALGLPDCLTGPIARGDSGTIERHLRSLEESAPHLTALYRELASATLPIAVEKAGLKEDARIRIERLIFAQNGPEISVPK